MSRLVTLQLASARRGPNAIPTCSGAACAPARPGSPAAPGACCACLPHICTAAQPQRLPRADSPASSGTAVLRGVTHGPTAHRAGRCRPVRRAAWCSSAALRRPARSQRDSAPGLLLPAGARPRLCETWPSCAGFLRAPGRACGAVRSAVRGGRSRLPGLRTVRRRRRGRLGRTGVRLLCSPCGMPPSGVLPGLPPRLPCKFRE